MTYSTTPRERLTLEEALTVADNAVKRFLRANRWAMPYREEAIQVARTTAWLCRANYQPALNVNEHAYVWGACCRQIVREVYACRLGGLTGTAHRPAEASAEIVVLAIEDQTEDPNRARGTLRRGRGAASPAPGAWYRTPRTTEASPEDAAAIREELREVEAIAAELGLDPAELVDGALTTGGTSKRKRTIQRALREVEQAVASYNY